MPMKLAGIVTPKSLLPDLNAVDRDEAIEEIIDALIQAGAAPKNLRNELVTQIIERENHGSTGFGKGVAVPHVKHEKIKNMAAAIAVSHRGVEFGALDKAPVYAIVLLLSPTTNPDAHLQAMENIFSHLQKDKFRRFLRQSTTADQIADLIHEADTQQLAN